MDDRMPFKVPMSGARKILAAVGFGLALPTAAVALIAFGCSGNTDHGGSSGSSSGSSGYTVPVGSGPAPDKCASPNDGCPCTNLGEKITCSATKLVLGNFEYCGGERTCDRQSGLWSTCVATVTAK